MKNRFNDVPFRPDRSAVHYGWFILAAGGFGILISSPGQTFGVSPFTDSLLEVLGLTRVQLSTAYMFGTILSSLVLTGGGKAYDRFGARVIGSLAAALLGIVLVVMSRCDLIARSLTQFLQTDHPTRVAFVVILLCFFLLRFSGQGLLTMVSRNMIMKWFDRKRGTVMGILGMVVSPCFALMPVLFNEMIEGLGWRNAWFLMGGVIGIVFSVLALIFFRDNPEDCGLAPDAKRHDKPNGDDPPVFRGRQFTLREALRTYSFWVFALSLCVFSLYITGLTFHIASIFENAEMTRKQGFAIFLPASIITVVLRPLAGWLCDHIRLRYMLAFMLVGVSISSIGVMTLSSDHAVWLVIAGNAMSGAVFGMLATVTWPNFFGKKHLGTISGMNMSLLVFFSAIGPWVFSQSLATSGSYTIAGAGCIAASLVFIIASLWAEDPRSN
jgi:OFA family oxalate/formate antiporter-like MFS transporter